MNFIKNLITDSPLSESSKTPQEILKELTNALNKFEQKIASNENTSSVEGIKQQIRVLLLEHPELEK